MVKCELQGQKQQEEKKVEVMKRGGKIVSEGLSHMPGGFAIEDGARVAIHPESDGIESFLRDAR